MGRESGFVMIFVGALLLYVAFYGLDFGLSLELGANRRLSSVFQVGKYADYGMYENPWVGEQDCSYIIEVSVISVNAEAVTYLVKPQGNYPSFHRNLQSGLSICEDVSQVGTYPPVVLAENLDVGDVLFTYNGLSHRFSKMETKTVCGQPRTVLVMESPSVTMNIEGIWGWTEVDYEDYIVAYDAVTGLRVYSRGVWKGKTIESELASTDLFVEGQLEDNEEETVEPPPEDGEQDGDYTVDFSDPSDLLDRILANSAVKGFMVLVGALLVLVGFVKVISGEGGHYYG